MKVGDLIRLRDESSFLMENGIFGIIVEAYDSLKGLWIIRWIEGGVIRQESLAHENALEVIA